jgi:hypothetical protein
VEYERLETALLKDVTDDYYYGCSPQLIMRMAGQRLRPRSRPASSPHRPKFK